MPGLVRRVLPRLSLIQFTHQRPRFEDRDAGQGLAEPDTCPEPSAVACFLSGPLNVLGASQQKPAPHPSVFSIFAEEFISLGPTHLSSVFGPLVIL